MSDHERSPAGELDGGPVDDAEFREYGENEVKIKYKTVLKMAPFKRDAAGRCHARCKGCEQEQRHMKLDRLVSHPKNCIAQDEDLRYDYGCSICRRWAENGTVHSGLSCRFVPVLPSGNGRTRAVLCRPAKPADICTKEVKEGKRHKESFSFVANRIL